MSIPSLKICWRSVLVKGQGHQGQKTRCALTTPPRCGRNETPSLQITSCKQQTRRFDRYDGVTVISPACVRWTWRATAGLCHAFLVLFIVQWGRLNWPSISLLARYKYFVSYRINCHVIRHVGSAIFFSQRNIRWIRIACQPKDFFIHSKTSVYKFMLASTRLRNIVGWVHCKKPGSMTS